MNTHSVDFGTVLDRDHSGGLGQYPLLTKQNISRKFLSAVNLRFVS